MVAQRLGQRIAQALFVRAALRRRDRVAIGVGRTARRPAPRRGPFDRPPAIVGDFRCGRRRRGRDRRRSCDLAARKSLGRRGNSACPRPGSAVLDQHGIAGPADLDAAEQIGLGAGHAVEPRRREMRIAAENLPVGPETDTIVPRQFTAPRSFNLPTACRARSASCGRAGRAPPRRPSIPTAR